jgi:predicted Zn-dependent protease
LAVEKGLNASGAFTTGATATFVANSEGVFAHFAATNADFQTVVMGPETTSAASGHAHASGWQAGALPVEALGREAILKAVRGANPIKIEPGEYTVILDPYATQDLVSMLNLHGMGAQAVLDGRSWMNGRIGKKVMSSQVSLWDDGLDGQGMPMPFDYEGVPRQRVEIVCEGVPMGPVYDRYTAQKAGKTSTGHALPPGWRGTGPLPTHLFMAHGRSSLDEMVRSTAKGLYITRFWYTRLVHPRDCVVTGMTRDGVFSINQGELAAPVKNLRFTQSYLQALDQVEEIGQDTRLLVSSYGGLATRVPALKIGGFNFTGVTA